jgi:ATP-dependent helicase/nuclease subunit A
VAAPRAAEPLAAGERTRSFELREVPGVSAPLTMEWLRPQAPPSSAASRLGEAMHRLLETWEPRAGIGPAQLAEVQRLFALDDAAARQAAAMALRIVQGEGAWAWDPAQIDWQGNEVELHAGGELLRLDRLVRRRDTGEWWVLDYKSAAAPERQPELRAQMQQYREAVAVAQGGAAVRCAFLTAQGRLVAA